MELEVLNIKGEKTGRTVTLADEIFAITPNDHVIYLDVKRIQNAKRQGTHKAKERNELKGSTRKLIKQKGGGGARRGDIKSGLLRGGGRIHGPRVRDYDIKLNKKVKALARKSALAHKAAAGRIIMLEDITMEAPKTKSFVSILQALGLGEQRSLFVMNGGNENVLRSARNIPHTGIASGADLNTYDLLHCNTLVITESALSNIVENFK